MKTLKLEARELALYQAGALAGAIQATTQTVARIREAAATIDNQLAGVKKGKTARAFVAGALAAMADQLEDFANDRRTELAKALDEIEASPVKSEPKSAVKQNGLADRAARFIMGQRGG